ncbi:MAG: ATP-dependent RNA helicase [Treponema sp.]
MSAQHLMQNNFDFTSGISSLPITPHLSEICAALKNSVSRFLILTAETAAGKSTAVPLALLNAFPQKILMLEPRRLAVLAVANRLADLLGQSVGRTAGYVMHLERRVSSETRIEVMTEAVLTRRMQENPALEGVSVVIIDEFHERSVHADLALAFLKEAMILRSDLFVLVMSATMDSAALASYLGTKDAPAPALNIKGRQFPVHVDYAGDISAAEAVFKELQFRRQNPSAVNPDFKSILVFLPGLYEIRKCRGELTAMGIPSDCEDVLTLHSSVPFAEQKKVLEEPDKAVTRIILSSAVAETSLTVPCVSTVIDTGKARVNRMNVSAGMERLVTENESVFSAEQRAGRAGRLCAGRCIRLWKEREPRVQSAMPEILRTDLTALVLECLQWGADDAAKIDWLDAPPTSAWNAALELLEQMGCVRGKKITELGSAALELGVHPRLACAAIAGSVKAALDYGQYASAPPAVQAKFSADLKKRLSKIPQRLRSSLPFEFALLAGFPDRIARRTDDGNYCFPSGRIARLPKDAAPPFPKWIVAPEVDAGEKEGQIRSFLPLDDAESEKWTLARAKKSVRMELTGGKARKTELTAYGKIILAEKKLPAGAEDFAAALCAEVNAHGISVLPFDERAESLILRRAFYEEQSGVPDAERKSAKSALSQTASDWLLPFLGGKTAVSADDVYNALYWHFDGAELDAKAPPALILPNGKKCRVVYETRSSTQDAQKAAVRPAVEIIVQQMFGCFQTPRIMGVPVLFKLLSPARRPLQITDDIEHFWDAAWPAVCKEMKGRYPKHNWNYRRSAEKGV